MIRWIRTIDVFQGSALCVANFGKEAQYVLYLTPVSM